MRKATAALLHLNDHHLVSIHAFLEEGDVAEIGDHTIWLVSIHAFLEEGDSAECGDDVLGRGVSIHAFLEEGDAGEECAAHKRVGFNPRLP